jgi:hypothetical protein
MLEIGDFRTICLGWPQTSVVPISASQVTRITGVSHLCKVPVYILRSKNKRKKAPLLIGKRRSIPTDWKTRSEDQACFPPRSN